MEALLASADASLQVLVAPAGSGKTTLAVQLLEHLEGFHGWVTLEPADNDPVRFWTYLAAAVTEGDELNEVRNALSDGSMGLQRAIDQILAVVEGRDDVTALVLDDFQIITNPVVHAQLGEILRHPPDQLRLIVTSRVEPPLPVGRLRTHGSLGEVRSEGLAFLPVEAEQLITGLTEHVAVRQDTIQRLAERTEGWAAGLHLAGLALRSASDPSALLDELSGETSHLSEYLTQEALLDQPEDVRRFLLDTSVLSELDPALCDALTGRVDSLQVLRQLAERNVFTAAVDDLKRQFRYHQLFREYLVGKLRAANPARAAEMNLVASDWYEQRGSHGRAVWHAFDAGDLQRSADVINAVWFDYSNAGQLETVRRWVELLGSDWTHSRSEMCLIMAWTYLNAGDYDQAEEWAERALAANTLTGEMSTGPWSQQDVVFQVASLRSFKAIHEGDPWQAVAVLEPAHRLVGEESSASSDGAEAALATAMVWLPGGNVEPDLLRRAVRQGQKWDLSPNVVNGHSHLALLAADAGDNETALAHADSALSLIETEEQTRFHRPAIAHLARGIAHRQMGRLADAQFALDEAEPISRLGRLPLCLARVELERARVFHLLGQRDHMLAAIGRARAILAGCLRPDALDHVIRQVENETRFAPVDDRHLPIGARELTERELTIIRLLPAGLPRRELAEQLHISENTVKTHLVSIRRKLGLQGREDIVSRAEELGLQ